MNISVIIPIYNSEKYLERCIKSLISQTYKNFEIILINDGSTDKSGMICDRLKKTYSNIIVVHKKNGGSASARNVGLSIANGKYIAFVDSDDYVKANYLEELVKLAENYNADLVQCGFEITKNNEQNLLNSQDKILNIKKYSNIEMLHKFCNRSTYLECVVLWNKLIKKDIFKDIKFTEGKAIDDEYLIHKILYKSNICIVTNQILYYYFLSEQSQIRSEYSLKKLDSIDAIESQLRFFKYIEHQELYNKLLYRYYSNIIYHYNQVKKLFKQEKEILKELKKKRKSMYKVINNRDVSFWDKILLIIKRFFPSIMYLKNIVR